MASRGVSVLKFVGTISLGVLTGVSYSLSSLTIPALLTLPSASAAQRALDALSTAATRHMRTLASLSSTAFALAYLFSPRPLRHPYLLYSSFLVLSSSAAASNLIAPYLLWLGPAPGPSQPSQSARAAAVAAAAKKERERRAAAAAAARARMEASYELLGSDAHSEGSAGEDLESTEDVEVNGEDVRVEVEYFLKQQIVRGAVAGAAFFLSIVGLWGDGVATVYGPAVVIEV
ncbi:hypothetical protein VTJ83DRAFT_5093 [Remersonia thermophila]|uniref:Autophagy-related protein 33 n=1 Tax=Remersonia thermophila TaxID=72144 RepID=A0ABR4DDB4_9PEZI